jgi:hypothetical protein
MRDNRAQCVFLVVACVLLMTATMVVAQETEALDKLEKPQPVVPEIFTIQGEFVRMAYNSEGFATLGYRTANNSVDEEWMLLELGLSLVNPTDDQPFKRGQLSVQLPDGSTIGMARQEEYNKANLRALDRRGNTVRDSINYFPRMANNPCRIGFFADTTQPGRTLAYDQVTLSRRNACVGRIYFNLPGGIKSGQYYLNVKFKTSVVQVPFRIFTDEEQREFNKNWKDIKKEHEAGYKE